MFLLYDRKTLIRVFSVLVVNRTIKTNKFNYCLSKIGTHLPNKVQNMHTSERKHLLNSSTVRICIFAVSAGHCYLRLYSCSLDGKPCNISQTIIKHGTQMFPYVFSSRLKYSAFNTTRLPMFYTVCDYDSFMPLTHP